MNEHLAVAATNAATEAKSSSKRPGLAHRTQGCPLLQKPTRPTPPALRAGWRQGSAAHLVPGSSLTKGNNSDKGIKIASNDGKHFVEGSVDKRGNRAVKKRGGEGHWGRSGPAVTGPGTQK